MITTPNPFRSAIAALFPSKPATDRQVGDDLHTAYARKIGVPVLTRTGPHPDAAMRPVSNRASRRQAQTRTDRLASYSRRPTARAGAES